MDYMSGFSSIVSIVSFVIFAAGVMKLFQMATTLSEIKDVLVAIKLNAPIHPAIGASIGTSLGASLGASLGTAAPTPSLPSGEDMLRAALSEMDHPVTPTSIELGNKS
jgi:hypothetical protein